MMQAIARLCVFENSGDSGDKPAKPSVGAGFEGVRQWGQSGDRLGTEWGRFYIVRMIHSIHLIKPVLFFLNSALTDLHCTLLESGASKPSLGTPPTHTGFLTGQLVNH